MTWIARPGTLKHGAPTGVRQPIPYSGVWPPLRGAEECDSHDLDDLKFCEVNHLSAPRDPQKVQELLQSEVDEGFVERFMCSEEDLRKRFPDGCLAVGKLGVVQNREKTTA